MKLISKIEKIAQFILLFELGDILINPAKNRLYAQINVQPQINDENLKNLIKNNPDQIEVDGIIIDYPLMDLYENKANIISYIKKVEIKNRDYIVRYTVYSENKPKSITIYSFGYKSNQFINKPNQPMNLKGAIQYENPLESLELLINNKNNVPIRISPDSNILNLIKEKLYKQ